MGLGLLSEMSGDKDPFLSKTQAVSGCRKHPGSCLQASPLAWRWRGGHGRYKGRILFFSLYPDCLALLGSKGAKHLSQHPKKKKCTRLPPKS